MNSKRSVNLDLRIIRLPVTAYTSILHYTSGVVLLLGIAMLLFALDESLSSEEDPEQVRACLTNPLAKLVVQGLLPVLLYHLATGARHLVMDTGVGETLEDDKRGSKIVITIAVVLTILTGV